MTFMGIDTVVFAAPDMDRARAFFSDWGLKKVSSGKSGTVFSTEVGSRVVLRPPEAKDLPEAAVQGLNFREVVWGVSSKKHLNDLAKNLSRDHEIRVDKDGTLHTVSPNGLGVGFRVWSHAKKVKPSRALINTPGSRERVDKVSNFYDRARPMRMGHIVFEVPDMKAEERFYTKRLGFVVSDRYAGGAAVFLRYALRSDHHNLFFIQSRAQKTALHHVAFEVRDIHEVFAGGIKFAEKGWATEVGPGRHPISSAYFWYFKNPCGGAVEYFCDPDYVTEAWKPTAYRVNRFSEWHMVDGIHAVDDGKERPSLAATRR